MYDWQVHIEQDWTQIDCSKVWIYKRGGDRTTDVITGFSEPSHSPIFTHYREGEPMNDKPLILPTSALRAIAELLKPGPSQGETKLLADTLAVERERVDAILRRAIVPS